MKIIRNNRLKIGCLLVPGFICSAAVYIVSRYFSEASSTIQARFEQANREYNELMN
ncbi:hypothetical protein [Thorsellia kenyensis]|uniref:Uncharacterized protein n=1 Tax=Thorsellia kenyensis TaxID=1549888 RepID=A0ABV6C716_9GAMM